MNTSQEKFSENRLLMILFRRRRAASVFFAIQRAR